MDWSSLFILLLLIVAVISLIKFYFRPVEYQKSGHSHRLRGKIAIVTGANSGIGFETASELALRGAKVILACRDVQKGREAARLIDSRVACHERADSANHRIVVKHLDLSDLKSVRAFAEDILYTESRLDILVNNAGMLGNAKKELTKDGLEVTMASNHFGHFLLTNLLLPLLKKSVPSRIIVLSSWSHSFVPSMDFANLNSEKYFSSSTVYSESKLANLLFVHQLAKKLDGSNVVVNAVNPGFVNTDLYCKVYDLSKLVYFALSPALLLFARTAWQGAQSIVFLAASEDPLAAVNGRYFYNCKEMQPSAAAKDDLAAKKLWELSAKLTECPDCD